MNEFSFRCDPRFRITCIYWPHESGGTQRGYCVYTREASSTDLYAWGFAQDADLQTAIDKSCTEAERHQTKSTAPRSVSSADLSLDLDF